MSSAVVNSPPGGRLIVECGDPGLVISLAEKFENVLRRIDFTPSTVEIDRLLKQVYNPSIKEGLIVWP